MLSKPITTDPELLRLLEESKCRVEAMTPDELAAMHVEQRESFVRGEMGWPADLNPDSLVDIEIEPLFVSIHKDVWADIVTKAEALIDSALDDNVNHGDILSLATIAAANDLRRCLPK